MKNLISHSGVEVLSRSAMKSITGGNPLDINVKCKCCVGDECYQLDSATCPENKPADCNGRSCGPSGYTLQDCELA